MKGDEDAQRRCPPIPPLKSLFRHDHYGFLAVPRDTLGFVSKRSLDELGEFGPGLVLNSSNVASANGKRLPPDDHGHKAEGWRRELVPFLHSLLPIAGSIVAILLGRAYILNLLVGSDAAQTVTP